MTLYERWMLSLTTISVTVAPLMMSPGATPGVGGFLIKFRPIYLSMNLSTRDCGIPISIIGS
ncbi:hypothetical protein M775_11475 [Neisseria gonorrhoeae MU_NG6]|nr:hypothetical protein M771_10040 [Neisseria gonorrhoeae MU_NG1]KLS90653.1 hypothetical protein M775_11475 [Neisseria gonorrhoeae MU_NG6]